MRIILILFFFSQVLYSQIENNIYELNSLDNNFLTEDVKKIIDQNIEGKQTILLGEAVHFSGSDFLAKTEFVKYLVTEHGYKDIAFEADFFSLLFDHNKRHLPKMWSSSIQCKELMTFLEEKNVTIWGFDNRIVTYYSYKNFTNKLSEFLKTNNIEIEEKFITLSNLLIKNQYESRKLFSKKDKEYLNKYISELLKKEKIQSYKLWEQILVNYQSNVEFYTIKDNKTDSKRIPIRDKQMAKNLDFIVKQNPDKKFVVWLANAHMSKCNHESMKGMTMGYQFTELNPNTSYHIAFGSINRYNRSVKEKTIIKASKNNNNILYYLPSIHKNYFLDSKGLTTDFKNKDYKDSEIFNLYNLYRKKTDLLNHFDALVFIGEEWIEVSYEK